MRNKMDTTYLALCGCPVRHENLKAFRKATINFFQDFDKYSDELQSLLGDGFEGHHYT